MQNRRKTKLSGDEDGYDFEDQRSDTKKKFSPWQLVLIVIVGSFLMISLFFEENIRQHAIAAIKDDGEDISIDISVLPVPDDKESQPDIPIAIEQAAGLHSVSSVVSDIPLNNSISQPLSGAYHMIH